MTVIQKQKVIRHELTEPTFQFCGKAALQSNYPEVTKGSPVKMIFWAETSCQTFTGWCYLFSPMWLRCYFGYRSQIEHQMCCLGPLEICYIIITIITSFHCFFWGANYVFMKCLKTHEYMQNLFIHIWNQTYCAWIEQLNFVLKCWYEIWPSPHLCLDIIMWAGHFYPNRKGVVLWHESTE